VKKLIKSLIPPIFIDLYRKLNFARYGWHGEYKNWHEVKTLSTGYDTDEIINKVREAAIKVKNGEAAYERDSVILNEIEYSWPLLAGIMFSSSMLGGSIKVLDFGGSLGTTYFQNKKFLDKIKDVSWNIVEQKQFVNVGKIDFEDKRLKFYYNIESCIEKEKPNILLLSSVLQYIEKPYDLLDNLLKYNFETILIDRTLFSKSNKKIKLQTVPPKIYKASYPCWFLDETEFINYLDTKDYNIIESFETLGGQNAEYIFKGFLINKKSKNK
jgi:putative methyltransferase (TIGR04325 family)